jgi:beta-lactamase class A
MDESNGLWLTRRAALYGAALLLPWPAFAAAPAEDRLDALEKRSGARIGVAAIGMDDGNIVLYRENERFIMCSTFKALLVATVLARADAGRENLGRVVRYGKSDMLDVSPATRKNLARGMSVTALCEAAIIYSDNTAANLLLVSIGGPDSVNQFLRAQGDSTTRLDRIEPALNLPDGDKDTTTPSATLGTLRKILLGDALSSARRARLMGWLTSNMTGGLMLRAGLPKGWGVGDKTGRWDSTDPLKGATNDIGIATPPNRKPILMAAYTTGGRGDANARQAVLAEVGRILADAFV